MIAPGRVVVRWTTVERAQRVDPHPERGLRPEDARRAAGFGSDASRAAFVVGRRLRDDVLSEVTGLPAGSMRFATGQRGKPRLAAPAYVGAAFNLSHSHGIVALAAARCDEIGLDVEALRPLTATRRLAERFLAPVERDTVVARSGAERSRAFLTVWTRKEAWLKATGRGISVRLSAVEVEPDPDRPPVLLSVPTGCGSPDDWTLVAVPLPVEAVATICLPAGEWELDTAEWRPTV